MVFKPGPDPNRLASPPGRPLKMPARWEKGSQIDELKRAMIRAAKKHGNTTLLDRFVEQAYTDNKVLVAVIKKILPDIASKDINVNNSGKVIVEYISNINRKLLDDDFIEGKVIDAEVVEEDGK